MNGSFFDFSREIAGGSTWGTWEPEDGAFDFSVLEKVLRAAQAHSVAVIVGTPTCAIPPWLAQKYPDILAETHDGRRRYGARQNFDLTHPGYLFHAGRMIRKLMEAVQPYSCVIGFQLDNETKMTPAAPVCRRVSGST